MFQTNNTDWFLNGSTEESDVLGNIISSFHKVNTSDERVVAAAQLAYDELLDFIGGTKESFSLGKINEAESKITENEGTDFLLDFEIYYVPTGGIMDCVGIVQENFTKAFEVKNVSCECCRQKDDLETTNVRNSKYIIVIKARFHY